MPPATPLARLDSPYSGDSTNANNGKENRNNGADLMALAVWVVQHVDDVVRQRPLEIATTGTGGLYISTLKDSQDRVRHRPDWRRATTPAIHRQLPSHGNGSLAVITRFESK